MWIMAITRLRAAMLAGLLIFGVCAFIPYYPQAQTNSAPATRPQEPTVDFPSADEKPPVFLTSEQEKRHAKNAVYDRPNSVPIRESPNATTIPIIDHWWLRVSALPVDKSNV
jgi:hypothetical protein